MSPEKDSENNCGKAKPKSSPAPPEYVIKSPIDTNEYSVITLENGLKALLISTIRESTDKTKNKFNPKTGVSEKVEEFNRKFVHIPDEDPENKSKSGREEDWDWEPKPKKRKLQDDKKKRPIWLGIASICLMVAAGSLHDPSDFKGMAHLYEHCCLSFGTKKYPELFPLGRIMNNCLAYWTAFTCPDSTVYFIADHLDYTGLDHFKTAIDCLSDCISDPILPKDCVNSEVITVDSEFSLSESHDGNRIWQLFGSLSKKNHPFRNFSCGNCGSLAKPNLYERLIQWKERYYAANYMTVVIRAALSLQDLEEIVRQNFSKIKSSPKISPIKELVKYGNPFATKEFTKIYKVVPASDIQFGLITWALPSTNYVNDSFKKPLLYLERFFGEDAKLMDFLSNQHWAYGIFAFSENMSGLRNFCSPFTVMIHLTDLGIKEFSQVIKSVYAYLATILKKKPQAGLFNAIRREKADAFHYKEGDWFWDVVQNAWSLSRAEEAKYVLTADKLITEFDEDFIQKFLEFFTPKNMNIIVCSKSFEEDCQDQEVEENYRVKYRVYDFDTELDRICERNKIYKEFQNQKCYSYDNPFRAKSIVCPVGDLFGFQLLSNDQKGLVKYLKLNLCSDGTIPLGFYVVNISCPMKKTVTSSSLLKIWSAMLKNFLRKPNSQSSKALIESFSFAYNGNTLIFIMYGQTIHMIELVKLYFMAFIEFEKNLDERTYQDYQNLYLKEYDNYILNPIGMVKDLEDFLQNQHSCLCQEQTLVTKNADFKDMKNFIANFKDRMFIDVCIVGCIPDVDAQTLTNIIRTMNYREIPEMFTNPISRVMQFPSGERCLRVKSRSEINQSSIVLNIYQFGNLERYQQSLLRKLVTLINFPAFNQLRTVEKLSYYIGVDDRKYCESDVLIFIAAPQSNRHMTGYVDERIDAFLADFRSKFPTANDVIGYQHTIGSWNREDLLRLYDDHLLPSGKNFRKLSIQVVGHRNNRKKDNCGPVEAKEIQEKIAQAQSNFLLEEISEGKSKIELNYDIPETVTEENGYFVTDLEKFKNSMAIYPQKKNMW